MIIIFKNTGPIIILDNKSRRVYNRYSNHSFDRLHGWITTQHAAVVSVSWAAVWIIPQED